MRAESKLCGDEPEVTTTVDELRLQHVKMCSEHFLFCPGQNNEMHIRDKLLHCCRQLCAECFPPCTQSINYRRPGKTGGTETIIKGGGGGGVDGERPVTTREK